MKHVVDIHSEMTGMDIYILCDDEEMGDRIEARFFDLVGEEDGLSVFWEEMDANFKTWCDEEYYVSLFETEDPGINVFVNNDGGIAYICTSSKISWRF